MQKALPIVAMQWVCGSWWPVVEGGDDLDGVLFRVVKSHAADREIDDFMSAPRSTRRSPGPKGSYRCAHRPAPEFQWIVQKSLQECRGDHGFNLKIFTRGPTANWVDLNAISPARQRGLARVTTADSGACTLAGCKVLIDWGIVTGWKIPGESMPAPDLLTLTNNRR
jgi:hypothetical protein